MFIIGAFILGFFTMLLWNALIPDIFHGPSLNYLQAVGLLVLARVLVGIRGHRRGWRPWRRRGRCGPPWSRRKQEWDCSSNFCGPKGEWWQKFAQMSPEERQKAKEEWKSHKEEWKSGKDKWKAEFTAQFGKPKESKDGE